MQTPIVGNSQNTKFLIQLMKTIGSQDWNQIASIIASQGIIGWSAQQLQILAQQKKPEAVKLLNLDQIRTIMFLGFTYIGQHKFIDRGMKQRYGGQITLQRTHVIFWELFRASITSLVVILGTKKTELSKFLKKLRYGTICKFLKLQYWSHEAESIQEFSTNSKLLITMMQLQSENQHKSRAEQYHIYSAYTTRNKFDLAMEYFQLLDLLVRISTNQVTKDIQLLDYNCKFCQPTIRENIQTEIYRLLFIAQADNGLIKRKLSKIEMDVQQKFKQETEQLQCENSTVQKKQQMQRLENTVKKSADIQEVIQINQKKQTQIPQQQLYIKKSSKVSRKQLS